MSQQEISVKELNVHEFFMKRCLQLAKNALGTAAPNPAVGCVIVHDNKVIGEGFTSSYGGSHAEVNAIQSVKDSAALKEATLYVTLEPCSHFGKTPPCTDLIIKYNISKIVIGLQDPFEQVAGKGIEKLQKAGCNIIKGVLEPDCRYHHRRFLCYQEKQRPYIILKWAESADGFIAPEMASRSLEKQPFWISNQRARQLVHKWRAEEQGILVGTNTVLADNPKLDVRQWYGKSPIRIFLDRELKINNDFHLLNGKEKTIVFTSKEVTEQRTNVSYEMIDFDKEIVSQILSALHRHKITSVLVEGGARTLNTFIEHDIWDEARVFTGDKPLKSGLPAPQLNNQSSTQDAVLDNTLNVYYND